MSNLHKAKTPCANGATCRCGVGTPNTPATSSIGGILCALTDVTTMTHTGHNVAMLRPHNVRGFLPH